MLSQEFWLAFEKTLVLEKMLLKAVFSVSVEKLFKGGDISIIPEPDHCLLWCPFGVMETSIVKQFHA